MQHTQKLVRLLALLAVVGLAALALPRSADAGVRVSVGIGVPVYPPPAVVYGGPGASVGGYYRGYYGHRHPHWRHHYHPHWRRW